MSDTPLGRFSRELGPSSGWLIFLGVILLIGGVVLLALPLFGGVVVTQWVMAVLVVAGIFQLVHALRSRGWKSQLWQGLSGLVYVIGGLAALFNPVAGAVALTIVLGAVFFVDGIVRIALGIVSRPHDNWGWIVLAGVVSLAVGIYLLAASASAPASLVVIGIFAGVSFVFEGAAFLSLGLGARAVHRR